MQETRTVTTGSKSSPEMAEDEMPIFFWGHTPSASQPYVGFSQWWPCEMTVGSKSLQYLRRNSNSSAMSGIPDAIIFDTAEQYMMYCKAIYFNDSFNAEAVLKTSDPREQKACGRAVKGFTQEEWTKIREHVVEEGNWVKFTQDEELKKGLLSTGDREICEASPYDRLWGIGFNEKDARNMVKSSRHRWGYNLLGKALMNVRERIREAEKGTKN